MKPRLTVLLLVLAVLLPQGGGAQWARNATPPPSTLLTGMVSRWSLDETSGTRFDSVGTNNLTDVNTVGYTVGKNGFAASFLATSSERLTRNAWNWSAYYASGWTISLWYKITGDQYWFLNRDDLTTREFSFARQTGRIRWSFYNVVDFNSALDSGDGTWNHLIATWDPADNKGRMYINGGSATASAAGTPVPGSVVLELGGKVVTGQYTTSALDEPILWSRVLTATERTCLQTAFYPYIGVCLP